MKSMVERAISNTKKSPINRMRASLVREIDIPPYYNIEQREQDMLE